MAFCFLVIAGFGLLTSKLLKTRPPLYVVIVYGLIALSTCCAVTILFFPSNSAHKFLYWFAGIALFVYFGRGYFTWSVSRLSEKILPVLYVLVGTAYLLTKVAAPCEIFDEGLQYVNLYHMFEQAGVATGAAETSPHLALNSSWHLLVALFNTEPLFQIPLYDLNGIIVIIAFLISLEGAKSLMTKIDLPSIIKIFVPILLPRNQITAAGTDIVVYVIGALILIHTLELSLSGVPKNQGEWLPLFLIPPFLFTVKVTTAPFLLIGIASCFIIFQAHRYVQLKTASVIILVLSAAWLIRNVLVSGYLIGAVQFGGFEVPWKMTPAAVSHLTNKTQFGTFAPHQSLSVDHLRGWFRSFPVVIRCLVSVSLLMTVAYIGAVVRGSILRTINSPTIILYLTLIAGFTVWFFTITEFRYGIAFHYFNVLLLVSLGFSFALRWMDRLRILLPALLIIGVLAAIVRNVQEFPSIRSHILRPAGNPQVEFHSQTAEDRTFFVPVKYIQKRNDNHVFGWNLTDDVYTVAGCWNVPFPCAVNGHSDNE